MLARKQQLLAIMPKVECRVLYLDHIAERGLDLFRVACERDLEGKVRSRAVVLVRTIPN